MSLRRLPQTHVSALRCIDDWSLKIATADPHARARAGPFGVDVYEYLESRLKSGLNSWRSPGQAAWQWWRGMNPGPTASGSRVVKCLVWATGASESHQTAPLGTPMIGEQWWPCIVLLPPGKDNFEISPSWPFYCPALALQGARPWFVHHTRIFEVALNYSDRHVDPDNWVWVEDFEDTVTTTDSGHSSSSSTSMKRSNRWTRSSAASSSRTSRTTVPSEGAPTDVLSEFSECSC